MERILEGKAAIVTGGARGIGQAIVQQLLAEGARVVYCARSQESINEAAGQFQQAGTAFGITADVAKAGDVEKLFAFADEKLGGLDILVNNAGVGVFRSVGDLTPEEWQQVVDTNLTGVYYCCHAALPRMRQRGGGFIMNISSLAGKNAFAGGAAYNASKFGLNGFSEALMLDHRNDDIRVCSIMPGSVDTGFNSGSKGASWKIAPEDIARIVIDVLRLPARTLVSRVEVRPAKPQKS